MASLRIFVPFQLRSKFEPLEHIMRGPVATQDRDFNGCCLKASVYGSEPIKLPRGGPFSAFAAPSPGFRRPIPGIVACPILFATRSGRCDGYRAGIEQQERFTNVMIGRNDCRGGPNAPDSAQSKFSPSDRLRAEKLDPIARS